MTNGNDLANPIFDSYGAVTYPGLTKRELFAAIALHGEIANGGSIPDDTASHAVHFANALIAKLNEPEATE